MHDLSGKLIIPFITHGGYGLGNSLSLIGQHSQGAELVEGFSMEAPTRASDNQAGYGMARCSS
ncbi:flavodoxin family protein [Brucella thiophenivorans]|uniref:Flavodoxin family protein n=2 Tax=Brucella thiophenivorans TaxID=571255 RepID=A0A256F1R8_9HYPH|nr:flavodoxin family protein [Brucella thiophenivorans]